MSALFRKQEPVFIKQDSSTELKLRDMRRLLPSVSDADRFSLERDIRIAEAGIVGENQVSFELANSQRMLYILHDLRLEHEGLSSEIDFFVITPCMNLIIECKDLLGDITVDEQGDFIREFGHGPYRRKEGLCSPFAQNERHLKLIKSVREADRGGTGWVEDGLPFDEFNKSLVVLANPRAMLHDRTAGQRMRERIIRADDLVPSICRLDAQGGKNGKRSHRAMRESADYWLSKHVEKPIDVGDAYEVGEPSRAREETAPRCPRCGTVMVRRIATTGRHAGQDVWRCPDHPRCRGVSSAAKPRGR